MSTALHVNDAIIALCCMAISAVLVSVARQVAPPFFTFQHKASLLRHSIYAVAAYTTTCGLAHMMQFTLMFGTQLWVIMIFVVGCAATSSVAALYLLYSWKQLSGVAADGREHTLLLHHFCCCTHSVCWQYI
eukprot:3665-Heterococcus_DN1.PRE.1